MASPYQGISIDGFPPELRRAHQNDDRAVMEAYGFDWRTMTESECVVELFKLYQKLVEVETAKTAGEMPASPGGATKHTCKKKMKETEKKPNS